MTQPLAIRGPWTLVDVIAAEQATVTAGAAACGYTCDCHGGYLCIRTADHTTAGEMCRDQHVGHQPDGALITWTVDDCPTPEQHAANMAEAKAAHAEHTRAFLTSLDPDVLAEFLTQAGTVPR